MASEKRLIDVTPENIKAVLEKVPYYPDEIWKFTAMTERFPTVDAVEVEDKELLKAIKILVEQYGHSKQSEYVHSPVAHALYHTWKKVDEDGRRKERQ